MRALGSIVLFGLVLLVFQRSLLLVRILRQARQKVRQASGLQRHPQQLDDAGVPLVARRHALQALRSPVAVVAQGPAAAEPSLRFSTRHRRM